MRKLNASVCKTEKNHNIVNFLQQFMGILNSDYSLDNFRNGQRSPLRSLYRSIDCQSVPPAHRLGNKHGRASAIFGYFSLSFPQTRTRRKRYCVSKKAQTQCHRMCIDRALRGQSLSGAKGVSGKTLYSGAGFPCVETNDSQGNPKNCPNYSNLSIL